MYPTWNEAARDEFSKVNRVVTLHEVGHTLGLLRPSGIGGRMPPQPKRLPEYAMHDPLGMVDPSRVTYFLSISMLSYFFMCHVSSS